MEKNIIGHNPNGLVSAFCKRNTFVVPTKAVTVSEEHSKNFGCPRAGIYQGA